MKKLFLVLLAGALFVACGNKAEEATEEVVAEEPVVEEVVAEEPVAEEVAEVPAEETTVKEEAAKAGKAIAKKAIQKGEEEAVKAIENNDQPAEAPATPATSKIKRR
ncbi:MAG: hypothetical protein MJZ76_03270 [Bacteroidales bacterium]|nr:hypothetical protein [Bacteroidales bacterium]